MPFYETCLECGKTFRLKTDLDFLRRGKDVSECEGFTNEPCLECSDTASEKRKGVRYWLPYVRDGIPEI